VTFDIVKLPKAELHCHLEGAAPPALVRKLADRHGMTLPDHLFNADNQFQWDNFIEFLNAYDMASAVIKTADDYADVTYEYLKSCALEGAIYVEVFSSPDHAAAAGMDYDTHLEGIVAGCIRAETNFGIIGRIIPTCVRHLGAARAKIVADQVANTPHPFVVGFGMGGDETHLTHKDFAPAYKIVSDAGLSTTVHAGEIQGAASVWAAISDLPVTRIGHGVRAIEDNFLVDELVKRNIHLEICPGSNIALSIFPDNQSHPLLKFKQAGVSFSLNSDDPPYFATSIGQEYNTAHSKFGLEAMELLDVTKTAIKASFVDETTKQKLLDKVHAYE